MKTTILSLLLAAGLAMPATAATFTWTEGNNDNRKLVDGSIDLEDASSGQPGFDLNASNADNAFGADDELQIHGRIVSAQDNFMFNFVMSEDFIVKFDLDGYLVGGQLETLSGLVGQRNRGGDPEADLPKKGVKFTLTNTDTNAQQTATFQTDILAGDNAFLFSGMANVAYVLEVDGSVGPNTNKAALYDLNVAAVPVPAAGFLLLGGLGGLMALRRRKKAV